MPPVSYLTFTGNPLAETTFEFSTWEPGRTQRARSSSFQMGGKGINVSKMLRRLGVQTLALSFLGGMSGEACRRWMQNCGFEHVGFPTLGATREGLVVRSEGKPETTFLGPDSPADAAAWREAARWLEARTVEDVNEEGVGSVFALCGSVPGWISEDAAPFRAVLDRWISSGRPVCADTYGPPLAWLAERSVSLVRVNADEFRGLLGAVRGEDVERLLEGALARWPVQAWVVTDGPGPVWSAQRGGVPIRKEPPRLEEVSATGSGDVMMACLLEAKFSRGRSLSEALDEAIPKAAANAAHPGIAEF